MANTIIIDGQTVSGALTFSPHAGHSSVNIGGASQGFATVAITTHAVPIKHAASPVGTVVSTAGPMIYDTPGNSYALQAVPGQILLNGTVVTSSKDVASLAMTATGVQQTTSSGAIWTVASTNAPGTYVGQAPSAPVTPPAPPVVTPPSGPVTPVTPGGANSFVTPEYDLSQFAIVQDYRFGNARADATIKNKSDLDLCFSPRYIYGGYTETMNSEGNGCDGLYGNYWARHIDTPEGAVGFQTQYGAADSVHVFTPKSLILKGRANPNTPSGQVMGRDGGGIISGILRGWAVLVPNKTFIRARVKLPPGKWGWSTLWLNPGHEDYAPLNGPRGNVLQPIGWPPEIDIEDGFGYDNVVPGSLLRPGEPTANNDSGWGRALLWDKGPWASNPGWDYRKPGAADGWLAAEFHELALDWTNNVLTYYCDGTAYTQRTLVWDNAPASACAHLLIGNQIVAEFNPNPYPAGVPDQGGYGPGGWDYEISDVQIYQRVSGVAPNPGNLSPAPGTTPDTKAWAGLPKLASSPSVKSFGMSPPAGAPTGAVNPSTYA